MEANKENKIKKTKIPLPLEHLPQLPGHLIKKELPKSPLLRFPLKTINAVPCTSKNDKPGHKLQITKELTKSPLLRSLLETNNAGPCVNKNENPSISLKLTPKVLDAKYVTTTKDIRLDWSQDYKPKGEGKSEEVPKVITPTLESNTIRRIKRSLKRPHSRELLRLPSAEHNNNVDSARRLLSFSPNLLPSDIALQESITDYTIDIYQHLLTRETMPQRFAVVPVMTRACVINWLLKVNDDLTKTTLQIRGENSPIVVQTACWLLDSYLGMEDIPLESLQLAGATCYWIAQKLQGRAITARKLLTYARNAFSAKDLFTSERTVLKMLKCPCTPVVPQDYISYFSWWCDNENYEEIELAATFICLSTLLINNIQYYEYPSVIGAAAVKNALILLKKKEQLYHLNRNQIYKWAKDKSTNLRYLVAMMRTAVRKVSSPLFEYRTPYELYSLPPLNIAQRIVSAANEFSKKDDLI